MIARFACGGSGIGSAPGGATATERTGRAMTHDTLRSPSQTRPAYAGIGSRATPPAVLDLMARAASWLSTEGWVLRTGMAAGADQAFYRGASTRGLLELYPPWPTFQAGAHCSAIEDSGRLVLGKPSAAAYKLAARFHPAWPQLTAGVRALHARNCHQVLGADLATPARFVVCWTPDGSVNGRGRRVGGTGQALRIAHHHDIPIFNLARPDHHQRLAHRLITAPR